MNKRKWFLLLLALVLVIGAGIGSAYAYFTTYSTAHGGYVVHIGNETEIEEEALGAEKKITIKNIGDYPVFVRAKIYAGDKIGVEASYTEGVWVVKNEKDPLDYEAHDVYYYQRVLEGHSTTNDDGDGLLTFTLTIPKEENVKVGDAVDVVIIYESVPAVFKEDGEPDFDYSWTHNAAIPLKEGGN